MKRWKCAASPKWLAENYTKREEMVPMRDGVRLYTALYEPNDGENHPVMLLRTPYPLNPYGKTFSSALKTYLSLFVRARYIIVFQNVRGQFASEGHFENVRPLLDNHDSPSDIDEATDTYDTAQWIIGNCNTNGSIGVKGVSYPGLYATMAAVSGHPSIKAVSPQAPVTDWWIGDDAHINGAFQSSMLSFAASFMRPRKGPGIRFPKSLLNIDKDIYDWFLEKEAAPELFDTIRDKVEFLGDCIDHPDYDDFWKRRNPCPYLKNIKPAVLVVGGFYDAEDCFGAFETYRAIRSQSPETPLFLAAGPWYHGGWRKPGYENLGDAWFGTGSAEYFLENIEYPFFAHYLEGHDSKPSHGAYILPSAETTQVVMQGHPSESRWEMMDQWPSASVKTETLYMASAEKLTDVMPSAEEEFSYVSDPMHPVPYCAETTLRISRDAMAADQRFASRRTDVLSFSTLPLDQTLKVRGRVKARLKVSITGTDVDIVVKILDIRPDGCHMLVRSGVMPLRYRETIEKGKAAVPGKIYELEFPLIDIAHDFNPGHRLMVQVQSSLFPLILMNPQTFVGNPLKAGAEDYRKLCVSLHGGSSIDLPILP